jgi:hypothetical protein
MFELRTHIAAIEDYGLVYLERIGDDKGTIA